MSDDTEPKLPEIVDWSECFITFEQSQAELEGIEKKLAARLGIQENVRETLILLDKNNKLVEDDLVADWHSALSSYLDYLENRE